MTTTVDVCEKMRAGRTYHVLDCDALEFIAGLRWNEWLKERERVQEIFATSR